MQKHYVQWFPALSGERDTYIGTHLAQLIKVSVVMTAVYYDLLMNLPCPLPLNEPAVPLVS